jgi:UDP-N-acetylglucosamine--N-acetylmuramyl-(pentapeptide) pyrophosphoryl-undecaprenol N-acetylglucosamine transferase
VRLAFAGGGTGGHIVPGLHLVGRSLAGAGAPALEDVVWFTSGRAVETRVLAGVPAELPWERVELALEPPGGGAPSKLRLLLRTPGATLRARRELRAHRAEVLLGLGGFTTLPAALAARSLGIPIVLLEINAAPGQATRVLSRLARRVLHAWRGTLPPAGEGEWHRATGAPVAPEVVAARHTEAEEREGRAALGLDPERPLLLVLGGSQGAGSLNSFVREHAAGWIAGGLQVLHQCGPGRRAELGPELAGLHVEEYFAPIAPALRAARMVLCRGGASTLAELAAAHLPAWVAPYPHHPDRHQERNALELGAGVRIVQDHELDSERARELAELMGPSGAETRSQMRAALEQLAPGDAALEILTQLDSLSRPKR